MSHPHLLQETKTFFLEHQLLRNGTNSSMSVKTAAHSPWYSLGVTISCQTGPLVLCHWAHPWYIWSLLPIGLNRFFFFFLQLMSGQTQPHYSKLTKFISVCLLISSAERSPKISFWSRSAPLHPADPSTPPFVWGVVLLPPPFLLHLAKAQLWSLKTHSRYFRPIPQSPVNMLWKFHIAFTKGGGLSALLISGINLHVSHKETLGSGP